MPLPDNRSLLCTSPANVTQRRRWLIVYNALVDPRPASQIALHTGVSVATVRLVISTYNRLGPASLDTPGKGGRRHEYLTAAQEHVFLALFFARAARGDIATSTAIHQALAEYHPVPWTPQTAYTRQHEVRPCQHANPMRVSSRLRRSGW